jgi:DNA-binding XRE family transcriptional regulator
MSSENELQKLFGSNVRQLREAQDLTQEEFSRKAGINRSYLGGVERDHGYYGTGMASGFAGGGGLRLAGPRSLCCSANACAAAKSISI